MVSAICLSLPAIATAQATTVGETTYGVKAGINISSLKFELDEANITGDGRAGLLAGFFVARDFNPRAGIQVEALLSQKGSEFAAGELDDVDASFKLTYIEFPVLARINFPVAPTTVRILAGPTFAFHVNETIKFGGVELDGDEVDLETFEMGFALGGAVEFKKFIVDARYIWGLTNINGSDDEGEPSVKNGTFAISFGYRFK
jgi:outer membrane protein with beta-barrel domain